MSAPEYQLDLKTRVHRILSLAVLALWAVLAYFKFELLGALRVASFFSLPVICIWFPVDMGRYYGTFMGLIMGGTNSPITESSHPTFLRYSSWAVLIIIPAVYIWILRKIS